ncbi:hypothetical protein MGSAQ_000921 [marine sediment metagenome]|uniref:Uncharacterized protein n=1 Tax=marine sediment metagenome TaxID=412755 RepID=A0A1B6NW37_9ZZZZ
MSLALVAQLCHESNHYLRTPALKLVAPKAFGTLRHQRTL